MQVNIWVLKDWLHQVYKITNQEIADEDVMERQIQVGIEFNKYTELVDRGILVEWSGAETLA